MLRFESVFSSTPLLGELLIIFVSKDKISFSRENFLFLENNLFFVGENVILFGKNFVLFGEKFILSWENFTLVGEISFSSKSILFFMREFLSDICNLFFKWRRSESLIEGALSGGPKVRMSVFKTKCLQNEMLWLYQIWKGFSPKAKVLYNNNIECNII